MQQVFPKFAAVSQLTLSACQSGLCRMQCSRIGGEGVRTFYKKTFGVWPAEVRRDRRGNVADDGKASRRAENVGVAVRSVSKARQG